MTLKGVPAELCAAFDLNPVDYTLLGVMADAADENGEPEVAECLRFLWKHRQVPDFTDTATWEWRSWVGVMPSEFWNVISGLAGRNHSGCAAVDRVLEIWPQHKQLLIDALEPVCNT